MSTKSTDDTFKRLHANINTIRFLQVRLTSKHAQHTIYDEYGETCILISTCLMHNETRKSHIPELATRISTTMFH
jgi:hypothetical protein